MVGTSLPVTPVRRQIIFTEPMPDLAPVVPFTGAARSRRKRNSRHGRHAANTSSPPPAPSTPRIADELIERHPRRPRRPRRRGSRGRSGQTRNAHRSHRTPPRRDPPHPKPDPAADRRPHGRQQRASVTDRTRKDLRKEVLARYATALGGRLHQAIYFDDGNNYHGEVASRSMRERWPLPGRRLICGRGRARGRCLW
jgi:hypothetical protein